jgi:hypothetical protein
MRLVSRLWFEISNGAGARLAHDSAISFAPKLIGGYLGGAPRDSILNLSLRFVEEFRLHLHLRRSIKNIVG